MRQCKFVSYIDGSVKLIYSDCHLKKNVSRETLTEFDDLQFDDAIHCVEVARRLAKKKFIDLALCNVWNYFATITLSPKLYPDFRMLSSLIDIRQCYNRFHVPYLFVPEYHKNGRIHYHALLNLSNYHLSIFNLIQAVNPHNGQVLRTNNGIFIYNSCYFAEYYGHNTFIPIVSINDSVNMSKYVSKYITKSFNKIGTQYYYRSRLLKNPCYKSQLLCRDDIVNSLDGFDGYYFNHCGVKIKDIGNVRYVNVSDSDLCQRLIAHFNNWKLEDTLYD